MSPDRAVPARKATKASGTIFARCPGKIMAAKATVPRTVTTLDNAANDRSVRTLCAVNRLRRIASAPVPAKGFKPGCSTLARKALLDCENRPQRQGGDGQRRRMHPPRRERFYLGRFKCSKNGLVPTKTQAETSFCIVVDAVVDARSGNADGIGSGLVGHDPVGRIGKRFGRRAESELTLGAPRDLVSQKLASETLVN